MDFLDIRKKARERAQARAAEEAAAKAPQGGAKGSAPDETVIEGALAERLQGLPSPGDPPPMPELPAEVEGRFTTWRPGTGAPPVVAPESADDFPEPRVGGAHFTIVPPAAFAPGTLQRDLRPSLPPPASAGGPSDLLDPLDDFLYRPDEAAPALPHLAPADVGADEPPVSFVREEYLTFLLGPEEYGVAIERVREVIRAPPITEVPRAPGHVLGVVTVRGAVVAVLDPRRRLGLPPLSLGEGQGKILIVDAGEGSCGLLVDRVASVVRLRPGSIEPCPQGIAGHRSEFLAGIGRDGDRLFTVLDVAALLRRSNGQGEARGAARRADVGA